MLKGWGWDSVMIISWQNVVYWVTCAHCCRPLPPLYAPMRRRLNAVQLRAGRPAGRCRIVFSAVVAERIADAAVAGDFSRYARRTRWTCKRAGNHDSGPRPKVTRITCQYRNHAGYRNYFVS